MRRQPSKPFLPDGPIPGENYTSDTKNYPWHRPPEITDLDDGVEKIFKKLTSKEQSYALLTLLQSGITVVEATTMFLMQGVGAGKMTLDFALLLAGPTAHMMKIMADTYEIKYEMGLDEEHIPMSPYMKAVKDIDPRKDVEVAEEIVQEIPTIQDRAAQQQKPATGFMGMQGGPNLNAPMGQDTGMPPEDNTEGMMQ